MCRIKISLIFESADDFLIMMTISFQVESVKASVHLRYMNVQQKYIPNGNKCKALSGK